MIFVYSLKWYEKPKSQTIDLIQFILLLHTESHNCSWNSPCFLGRASEKKLPHLQMNLKNKEVALSAGTNWLVPILEMINMSMLELHWITYDREGKGDVLREILYAKILVRDREGKFLYWDIRIDYIKDKETSWSLRWKTRNVDRLPEVVKRLKKH